MKDSPCNGCLKRYPVCHDHCKDYLEWKQAEDAKKQEYIKSRNKHNLLVEYSKEQAERARRRG